MPNHPVPLTQQKCQPCEGGVSPLSRQDAEARLAEVPGWALTYDGKSLHRAWRVKDFSTALDFLQRIGAIAEMEDHHPDLHLTSYRQVRLELSTHAIDGLSLNDFILAAKINDLPVELVQK